MARPRLGEEERRTRTVGVRVTGGRGGGTAGAAAPAGTRETVERVGELVARLLAGEAE